MDNPIQITSLLGQMLPIKSLQIEIKLKEKNFLSENYLNASL